MTNNPTIDGVSREQLERFEKALLQVGRQDHLCDYSLVFEVKKELRTLLDAPVEPFNLDGWGIDHSAGRPVLVHNKCSVIEAEQAYGLLELINAAKDAPVVERCTSCDDSGDLTDLTGEWRGYCACPIGEALKNKPVVERKPVGYVHQWEIERIAAGNAHWATLWNSDGANNPSRNDSPAIAVYTAPPEVAALQSTIAQLQARVQELESGRGEPIYEQRYGGGWINIGREEYERCLADPEEASSLRIVFTAPPAPVAVVLPERKPVTAGLLSESNTHNQGWNACLDATAALNEKKS